MNKCRCGTVISVHMSSCHHCKEEAMIRNKLNQDLHFRKEKYMPINCPECGHINQVDGEVLPDFPRDDAKIECVKCGHEFKIGWYAVLEIR